MGSEPQNEPSGFGSGNREGSTQCSQNMETAHFFLFLFFIHYNLQAIQAIGVHRTKIPKRGESF